MPNSKPNTKPKPAAQCLMQCVSCTFWCRHCFWLPAASCRRAHRLLAPNKAPNVLRTGVYLHRIRFARKPLELELAYFWFQKVKSSLCVCSVWNAHRIWHTLESAWWCSGESPMLARVRCCKCANRVLKFFGKLFGKDFQTFELG